MPNLPLNAPILREDLPLYPPTPQLLRVTDDRVPGPSGVAQVAGSSVLGPTLYVAYTQQMRTDGLLPRDREPCLVDDVNGDGLTAGYYVGRLSGSHNSLPVYTVGRGAGSDGNPGVKFAKLLNDVPDSDNRFDARLQEEQSNGKLTDTGINVWLRDARNLTILVLNNIYMCTRTGFDNGRPVYTEADFPLVVGNQTLSQRVDNVLFFLCVPNRCWDVTEAGGRIVSANRILQAQETSGTLYENLFRFTFDPATNWEVDDADEDGDVIVRRVLNVRHGTSGVTTLTWQIDFDSTDFDVAATATGHATVNTEGYTGDFYVLTNCVAGVLKKRLLSFVRGLLKSVGAEIDL